MEDYSYVLFLEDKSTECWSGEIYKASERTSLMTATIISYYEAISLIFKDKKK